MHFTYNYMLRAYIIYLPIFSYHVNCVKTLQDLTDIASLDLGTTEFSQDTTNQVTLTTKFVEFFQWLGKYNNLIVVSKCR